MKGWYGDTMRHSMSAKGITTIQYTQIYDKEKSRSRLKALHERQNYLSKFHSDWFIDKLMLYKPTEFKKDKWISLDKRNRDKRIKDSIGKKAFIGFGYVIDEMYGIEAILKDIGKNFVTVEIDGDDLKVRDFTVRYIERDEELAKKKPRKVNIPKGEFRFMLKEDTKNSEVYEALPEDYDGVNVVPVVRMWYSSKYRDWDVTYSFLYGEDYGYKTPNIYIKSGIPRREARNLALRFIDRASIKDIEKLSDFHKEDIRKGVRR